MTTTESTEDFLARFRRQADEASSRIEALKKTIESGLVHQAETIAVDRYLSSIGIKRV